MLEKVNEFCYETTESRNMGPDTLLHDTEPKCCHIGLQSPKSIAVPFFLA